MQSILQVLKLNDKRSGVKGDRAWEMQDAECLILNDDGSVAEVGVLMIPKDMMGKVNPGTFIGSFALRADKGREGGRRINAVLVGLQPYEPRRVASAPSSPATAPQGAK